MVAFYIMLARAVGSFFHKNYLPVFVTSGLQVHLPVIVATAFSVIVTPGLGVTVNIGLDLCAVFLDTVINYEAIWYTSGS